MENYSKHKFSIFIFNLNFLFFQQTYGQWQIVFSILAATYIIGSLAFLTMGTGELQPWNNPPERIRSLQNAEEAVPLKKNTIIVN